MQTANVIQRKQLCPNSGEPGGSGPISENWRIANHKYGSIATMRTTVDIPDAVYRRLKSRAAHEGRSAKELILQGVEHVLDKPLQKKKKNIELPLVRSKQPGTLELDNERIFTIISFP